MSIFIDKHELAEKKDIVNPNLLSNSKRIFQPKNSNIDNHDVYKDSVAYLEKNQAYTISGKTNGIWSGTHEINSESDRCVLWFVNNNDEWDAVIISSDNKVNNSNSFVWAKPTDIYYLRVNSYKKDNSTKVWDIKVERGTVATPYVPALEDYAMKSDLDALKAEIEQLKQK